MPEQRRIHDDLSHLSSAARDLRSNAVRNGEVGLAEEFEPSAGQGQVTGNSGQMDLDKQGDLCGEDNSRKSSHVESI